ncbi:MAG: hypothetical protein BJ554DRAFT_6212, partial [Olpidium bornovanus]
EPRAVLRKILNNRAGERVPGSEEVADHLLHGHELRQAVRGRRARELAGVARHGLLEGSLAAVQALLREVAPELLRDDVHARGVGHVRHKSRVVDVAGGRGTDWAGSFCVFVERGDDAACRAAVWPRVTRRKELSADALPRRLGAGSFPSPFPSIASGCADVAAVCVFFTVRRLAAGASSSTKASGRQTETPDTGASHENHHDHQPRRLEGLPRFLLCGCDEDVLLVLMAAGDGSKDGGGTAALNSAPVIGKSPAPLVSVPVWPGRPLDELDSPPVC